MHFIVTLGLLQLLGNCYGLYNKQSQIVEPHVETYWESWVESHCPDFACNLADIPISPIGSKHGVNVVNLAFARPGYGTCDEITGYCNLLPGYQGKEASLREAVDIIHSKGGLIKIAIGGSGYGNPTAGGYNYTMPLADTIEEFNLDGVDFTAVQWDIMDEAGVAEMIKKLREYMPNKLISVTLPIHQSAWNTLIRGSEPYVDYFNIYGANSNDLWFIEDDIPKSKIVWGVEIARDCLMEATFTAASTVRNESYSGVMTWAINTDTDQRNGYEYEECNGFQTGHPDGSYVDMISYLLNHDDE